MTNKRKIQILKKVIKRLEKIVPKFDKDETAYLELEGFGICTLAVEFMSRDELNDMRDWCRKASGNDTITPFFREEMKITMPSKHRSVYCWEWNKRGYQARINACKKAIERLSRELPTAN